MSPVRRHLPPPGALPLVRAVPALLLALVVAALLPATVHAASGRTYVAFGDSYTSGLGMPDQRATPSGEPRCFRSARNYPSKVADRLALGAERTGGWADFSCSNATLAGPALLSPLDLMGEVALAERAGALGRDTRFVTLTGGGNDRWDAAGLGLFAGAVICLNDAGCGATPPAEGFARPTSVTGAAFAARATPAIVRIRKLAPKARIALVAYPEVLPSTGPLCRTDRATTTPAPAGSADYARAAIAALMGAQRTGARSLGLTFVDTTTATTGHDICRGPGVRWYARTGDAGADPVHPIEAAHTAIARAVYASRPSIPRARLRAPSAVRVGRTATLRATALVRASGYRARLVRRASVGGRTRTCTAPVGARGSADGTATFRGRAPSRLVCAGAPSRLRRIATPAGRATLRVCVESSSGACRTTGSTVTDAVTVRR